MASAIFSQQQHGHAEEEDSAGRPVGVNVRGNTYAMFEGLPVVDGFDPNELWYRCIDGFEGGHGREEHS